MVRRKKKSEKKRDSLSDISIKSAKTRNAVMEAYS